MQIIETFCGLQVPDWALSYLVNGDCSGFSEEDVDAVDLWWADWVSEASERGGYAVFSVGESHNEFCTRPEFGKPCACTDCKVIIWKA